MKQTRKPYTLLFLILVMLCLLSGCTGTNAQKPATTTPTTMPSHTKDTPSSQNSSSLSEQPQKGSRDNTAVVRTPIASGTVVFSCDTASLDASHTEEGYLMAEYTGSNEKVKLQITGPNQVTYTYNLHGNGYEVFPLTAGDGTYTIGIYENVSGKKYALLLSTDIEVLLSDPLDPYLYPNQYVNFTASSLPVDKATSLAYTADTDLEVVEFVYNYMIENFTYDYEKAANVSSGYLPVIDEVYQAKCGICFDYAAVMAAMLRSQNIPTRLEVGYMEEDYHAWISIYIEEFGWINGIIEFDGSAWTMLDPTFASSSKSPKSFLTESEKYTTKYVY